MDAEVLYARLMDLANALGVEVRTAAVAPPGGTCHLRGRPMVMLSSEATLEEKLDVLAAALAGMPGLEEMFILPQVRDCLEAARQGKPQPKRSPSTSQGDGQAEGQAGA